MMTLCGNKRKQCYSCMSADSKLHGQLDFLAIQPKHDMWLDMDCTYANLPMLRTVTAYSCMSADSKLHGLLDFLPILLKHDMWLEQGKASMIETWTGAGFPDYTSEA